MLEVFPAQYPAEKLIFVEKHFKDGGVASGALHRCDDVQHVFSLKTPGIHVAAYPSPQSSLESQYILTHRPARTSSLLQTGLP
jgi:hypothetical protein